VVAEAVEVEVAEAEAAEQHLRIPQGESVMVENVKD
jgi:hypothetical protein